MSLIFCLGFGPEPFPIPAAREPFFISKILSVPVLSLQKHAALPQRKVALIQKDMFVLNTAFVGRHWDVVLMLKLSSIFCRNCVLLKGHCSSIHLR